MTRPGVSPELIDRMEKALLSLDYMTVMNIIMEPDRKATPIQMVEALVAPALERIGQAWEKGTAALSQVYMSGRICEELVDRILPPADPDRKSQPRMAIAVLEDYHLLGKRIVYSLLRSSGFEIFDYGRMDAEGILSRVRQDKIRILLVSVLMLPSALRIKNLVSKSRESGSEVKFIVGGAPFLFDDRLWREVGADAMGRDASESIKIIEKIKEEIS